MSDHYIITADHGHLRIYQHRQDAGQLNPAFDEVHSMDFPAGVKSYTEHDSDMAGRFQSSNQQSRGPGAPTARMGMSIDERLPMQREEQRRQIRNIAEAIDSFLRSRPQATWDFAAGPSVHNAVLDALTPPTRERLQQAVSKDLVNQPTRELATHFTHR